MSEDKRDEVGPPHDDGASRRVNGVGHAQVNGANHAQIAKTVDPHGRAALLLVESLIHALVDKEVLTRGEAIDIIDIAADVEDELAHFENEGTPPRRHRSLLAPLATSFRSEIGE